MFCKPASAVIDVSIATFVGLAPIIMWFSRNLACKERSSIWAWLTHMDIVKAMFKIAMDWL